MGKDWRWERNANPFTVVYCVVAIQSASSSWFCSSCIRTVPNPSINTVLILSVPTAYVVRTWWSNFHMLSITVSTSVFATISATQKIRLISLIGSKIWAKFIWLARLGQHWRNNRTTLSQLHGGTVLFSFCNQGSMMSTVGHSQSQRLYLCSQSSARSMEP